MRDYVGGGGKYTRYGISVLRIPFSRPKMFQHWQKKERTAQFEQDTFEFHRYTIYGYNENAGSLKGRENASAPPLIPEHIRLCSLLRFCVSREEL